MDPAVTTVGYGVGRLGLSGGASNGPTEGLNLCMKRIKRAVSTFALSRSPTFKLSTIGPRRFFLLHRTPLRPLTPLDELCDLPGQVVG